MNKQNYQLYSFLLIFVLGYTGVSTKSTPSTPTSTTTAATTTAPAITTSATTISTTTTQATTTPTTPTATPTTPTFISYTCSGGKVTDMSITDTESAHVIVLTKDGGYCLPQTKNKAGVLTCIGAFNKNVDPVTDQIKDLTILYGDVTLDGTVGGINSKYYTLSCVEKVGVVTVVMSPMTVGTGIPPTPTVIHAELMQHPTLTVVDPKTPKYVGEKITLQMAVNSNYILLPQSCTAHHTDPKKSSHKFWDNCHLTDTAIIPSKTWKTFPVQTPTQSTLQIDMYAFRFVDTEELIIKCQTTICPSDDDINCDMTCNNRRKKRRVNNLQPETNSTSATVSLALKVFDRQFQDNSCQALSPIWYIYTIGFGMIYWTTLKL